MMELFGDDDGGDDELRTSVYPSNLAPIGAKLRQRAFRTICNFRFFDAEKVFSAKFSNRKVSFSSIWLGFGGPTAERTSKSTSSSNFAPDRLILRSVRQKIVKFEKKIYA